MSQKYFLFVVEKPEKYTSDPHAVRIVVRIIDTDGEEICKAQTDPVYNSGM